jgi:hypothetical protein
VRACKLVALRPRACQRCFFPRASCSRGESIFCIEQKCSKLEHQGGGHAWGILGILFGRGRGIGNLMSIVFARVLFARKTAGALAIYPSRMAAGVDSRSG